mmetsp:Transcript_1505/g.4713  ORF Transcript_1505/g.4713 Transcript_1505/m.4713 type:complete len:420 (+) Transcript_1505:169-1428(+)
MLLHVGDGALFRDVFFVGCVLDDSILFVACLRLEHRLLGHIWFLLGLDDELLSGGDGGFLLDHRRLFSSNLFRLRSSLFGLFSSCLFGIFNGCDSRLFNSRLCLLGGFHDSGLLDSRFLDSGLLGGRLLDGRLLDGFLFDHRRFLSGGVGRNGHILLRGKRCLVGDHLCGLLGGQFRRVDVHLQAVHIDAVTAARQLCSLVGEVGDTRLERSQCEDELATVGIVLPNHHETTLLEQAHRVDQLELGRLLVRRGLGLHRLRIRSLSRCHLVQIGANRVLIFALLADGSDSSGFGGHLGLAGLKVETDELLVASSVRSLITLDGGRVRCSHHVRDVCRRIGDKRRLETLGLNRGPVDALEERVLPQRLLLREQCSGVLRRECFHIIVGYTRVGTSVFTTETFLRISLKEHCKKILSIVTEE